MPPNKKSYDLPFQAVHVILQGEVHPNFHDRLSLHFEGIGIAFVLHPNKSVLHIPVEFQFHYIYRSLRFQYEVYPALCRMLFHHNFIIRQQSEEHIEHLLEMPLIMRIVTIRYRLQETG